MKLPHHRPLLLLALGLTLVGSTLAPFVGGNETTTSVASRSNGADPGDLAGPDDLTGSSTSETTTATSDEDDGPDRPERTSTTSASPGHTTTTWPADDPDFPVTTVPPVTPHPLVREFKTGVAGDNPTSIAAGADGALWFTLEKSKSIGRMTVNGKVTLFPVPDGLVPRAVVKGADDAIWFSTYGSIVGRIDSEGEMQKFVTSAGMSMVALPDAILSVRDNGGLIHMSLDGKAQTVFGDNHGPGHLFVDQEGRIWFAGPEWHLYLVELTLTPSEAYTSKMTPYNTAERYPSLMAQTAPGSLWILHGGSWASPPDLGIAKVTTPTCLETYCRAETIKDFAIPGQAVEAMVAGPDGNVWFAQRGEERIGRLTPKGDITFFEVKAPQSLTVGEDGNVWFAEMGHYTFGNDGNRIGRIDLDQL